MIEARPTLKTHDSAFPMNLEQWGAAFFDAAAEGKENEIRHLIGRVPQGENWVNLSDEEGRCALHLASYNSQIRVMEILIECGADLEWRDSEGKTPLLWALQDLKDGGDWEALMVLARLGADVNVRDESGWTPLHWAAYLGCIDQMQILIDVGADLDVQEEHGRTPLHWATQSDAVQAVNLLTQAGARIDIRDHDSQLPCEWVTRLRGL